MATRLRVLLFSILPVLSLFSFEFSENDVEYCSIYGIGFEIVNQKLIISKAVTIKAGKPKSRYYEYINSSDLNVNHNGYFHTVVFGESKCIIPGSRFLYLFPEDSNDMAIGFQGDFDSSAYVKEVEQQFQSRLFMSVYYAKNMVSFINSSTILQDRNITYDTFHLNKRILYNGVEDLAWNGDAQPWAEGVAGPGIGETLTIEFTEPSQDIVILNGFVDPLRRHLYRHNNRVKTAIIRSADSGEPFEFEHTFEDVVHFDEIPLPRPARKLIFEIKDVYPGEKWDDTCISAVLTREPDPYK